MEFYEMGACALGRLISEREASSREVTQAHLDRVAELNPRLNAVVEVLAERALAEADRVDGDIRAGDRRGTLHGVPFTVKSNIDLSGSPTTQGIVALRDALPDADSPHVRRLRRNGAIAIARSNMPDWGFRWHTDNALFGATVNPWDGRRTPGGSGGGDAAAVATGMTPLALGNDYGGSLRFPAQACGVASLRPSRARVPYSAFTSPDELPFTIQQFGVQGVSARHVADLTAALHTIAGRDPDDPWTMDLTTAEHAPPRRVAVTVDPSGRGVDPDVAIGVRRAAAALADGGYDVEEVEPPALEHAAWLWAALVATEARLNPPFWFDSLSGDERVFVEAFLEVTPDLDLAGYARALADRQRLARQWAQFQTRYPIVLGPVTTRQPFVVGDDLAGSDAVAALVDSGRLMVGVGVLDLPVVVAPVAVVNGLPQAVQLIAPHAREDVALAAAEVVEQHLGVLTPVQPGGTATTAATREAIAHG